MEKTLEELKAENAKAEEEANSQSDVADVIEDDPQEEAEAEVEAVETEAEESEEVAETETDEDAEEDAEAWMQSDEPASQDADKKYSGADIGNAKAKLRAKLEKKHSKDIEELEQLRAENERLKSQGSSGKALNKPNRDDFDDEDDYLDALLDYREERQAAKKAADSNQRSQEEQAKAFKAKISQGTDQHYERAITLSEKSGISAEAYQASDLMVRQAINNVFPEAGDVVVDTMITNLGEGSEKVFYNLGVNSQRRAKLVDLLKSDTSGMQAAIYLGQLKSELEAPAKRKTNAPKPAPVIGGDSAGGDVAKALKRKYSEADKKGDAQARFNARREAKKQGIDVSNW